jgi:hypothetical protein
MSTAFRFSRRIDIGDIPAPAKSAGAHLSAKLELFHTDERTLTDELCDMLCIWLGMQAEFSASTSPLAFDLTLSKTTVGEEAQNGADLELIVSTPLGTKRCLMQAKVLDPSTKRLRCDSSPGWRKLRKQLVAARKDAGDLAFLLIYVPASVLDADHFGFTTYEQGLYLKAGDNVGASGNLPAYFGATLIAVSDLLGPSGRWRSSKFKVPQTRPGQFKAGVPFWRLLLELLLCRRSTWSSDSETVGAPSAPPFRTLGIAAGEVDQSVWREIQNTANRWLGPDHG